ncbi:MAG: hypothetical protein AAFX55_09840, partial [Bacteroidota bacterium]
MKSHKIITLWSILFCIASGFSQDYVHALVDVDKVEIVSRASVILKTHDDPSFLISSKENKRLAKKGKGLKSIFDKYIKTRIVFAKD